MKRPDSIPNLLKNKLGLENFVGESPEFLAEIRKIPAFACCEANLLITGETGTGKDICARGIHNFSPRRNEPFVPVNCGAIPPELVENELFGHAPGAFTSASRATPGLIRAAGRGTLFLDEIDALPLLAQVTLLRFLQEKEVRALGARKMQKADVRVIAATNSDLGSAVRVGRFRQDLYYRLNVLAIHMPSLRRRPGDVPLLARHFITKFTTQLGKDSKTATSAALRKLDHYEWPGNVRELEHVIERAVAVSAKRTIEAGELVLPQTARPASQGTFRALKAIAIAEFEREYIKQQLISKEGNITKASQAAGMDRKSFQRLIQKSKRQSPHSRP